MGHREEACRKKQRNELKGKHVNFITARGNHSIYYKTAKINKQSFSAFVDFGSECTLMRKSIADKITSIHETVPKTIKLFGFTGDECIMPNKQMTVTITIDGVSVETLVYILADDYINHDLIIGHSFTEDPRILVIKTNQYLNITKLPTVENGNLGDRFTIRGISAMEDSFDDTEKKILINENLKCGELSSKNKQKLDALLNEFEDRFSFNLKEIGKTSTSSMKIELLNDKPIVYTPYRLSWSERDTVKSMIQELLACNIIRESRSPYASPILLVKKKDGGSRLCVDFRALNQITKKFRHPLPLIDDVIDRLGGFKHYITLDLASGYYQVSMHPDSIELTAFITPDGHYEFLQMPFGLANAPAEFSRLMKKVLEGLEDIALVYLDDIIIPCKSVKDGLSKLRRVFEKLRNHNLTLKLSKCSFFQESVDYLGREVSRSGVRPGMKKILAVADMPMPRNVKQVRQFLGLAGYFRKFVENFATIAQPLTKLLKKDYHWQWENEQENAIRNIKKILTKRPILTIFDPNLETEVHTDASQIGLGGMLLQIDHDKNKHVVAYYSRQTSSFERKYHSYELETLAVLESLRHFRVYVVGIRFKLVTDCSAIRSAAVKRDLIPRIGRWWMELQEYDFIVEYRPASKMAHVDCLSRNPKPIEETHFINQINITETEWLEAVQLQDEEICRIKEILSTKENTSDTKQYFNDYILKDKKLYRKLPEGPKWVVPKTNRWQICKLCHDDIGHFGLDKTLMKIKENYWFAGMRRFVKKYVQACLNCIYYKVPSGRKPGYLHPIDKVNIPFHTIHLDHLGPFVKSEKNNTHILVIVDGFSKFTIIEPVRSTKTKYVIRAMTDLINIFGVPDRVISDRGSAFTSHTMKTFCAEFGIKHVLNAVATPRANGQCERFNRTILSSLAAMNGGFEDEKWDMHVKTVQRGLNGTVHRVLGKTPSEVLFGCKPRSIPESILLGALQTELHSTDLSSLRQEIANRIKEDQQVQKISYDKKRGRPREFQVGDVVAIMQTSFPATGDSKKLLPKFKGPYRITAKLPNDRYAALKVSERYRKCPAVISVDKIKPWITLKEWVK